MVIEREVMREENRELEEEKLFPFHLQLLASG